MKKSYYLRYYKCDRYYLKKITDFKGYLIAEFSGCSVLNILYAQKINMNLSGRFILTDTVFHNVKRPDYTRLKITVNSDLSDFTFRSSWTSQSTK